MKKIDTFFRKIMANNDLQSVSKSVKNNMMIGYKMFARYY